MDPDDMMARLGAAVLLASAGRKKEAELTFGRLAEARPSGPLAAAEQRLAVSALMPGIAQLNAVLSSRDGRGPESLLTRAAAVENSACARRPR